MVVNFAIQSEINRKENKFYPYRFRVYHPNLKVRALTGKFYARHDFPDPSLLDEELEKAILREQMVLSKDKYKEPLTHNMEYGWYIEPEDLQTDLRFHYPKRSNWITQIGAIIAIEDMKNPKKPFTGIAFKV